MREGETERHVDIHRFVRTHVFPHSVSGEGLEAIMSFLVPMITDLVSNMITQQKEPELLGEMVNSRAGKGKYKSGASCSMRKEERKRKRKKGRKEKKGKEKTHSNEMAHEST